VTVVTLNAHSFDEQLIFRPITSVCQSVSQQLLSCGHGYRYLEFKRTDRPDTDTDTAAAERTSGGQCSSATSSGALSLVSRGELYIAYVRSVFSIGLADHRPAAAQVTSQTAHRTADGQPRPRRSGRTSPLMRTKCRASRSSAWAWPRRGGCGGCRGRGRSGAGRGLRVVRGFALAAAIACRRVGGSL